MKKLSARKSAPTHEERPETLERQRRLFSQIALYVRDLKRPQNVHHPRPRERERERERKSPPNGQGESDIENPIIRAPSSGRWKLKTLMNQRRQAAGGGTEISFLSSKF
jgi:hypothetical protein